MKAYLVQTSDEIQIKAVCKDKNNNKFQNN